MIGEAPDLPAWSRLRTTLSDPEWIHTAEPPAGHHTDHAEPVGYRAAHPADLERRFPQAEVHDEICHATQCGRRRSPVWRAAPISPIVVGDPRSNNTNRLVQVAEELASCPSIRIESLEDLTPEMIEGQAPHGGHGGRFHSEPGDTRGDSLCGEPRADMPKLTPTPER